MKAVQKLEIGFGLATLVAMLALFYLFYWRLIWKDISNNHWDGVYGPLISGFLFIILPAFLIGIGSVFHALTQNLGGFIAVLLGGSASIVVFGLSFFALAYYTGWLGAVIFSTPAWFAALTIFFAFRTKASPLSSFG